MNVASSAPIKHVPWLPNYQWICHSCGATNPPRSSACSRCHMAAVVSTLEIEASKRANSQVTFSINLRALFSRRLIAWLFRAWPVLGLIVPIAAHLFALSQFPLPQFPSEHIFINKITGAILQVGGGLIVLYSIDANLGLFRNRKLVTTVIGWFAECPIISRSVTLSATGCSMSSATSSCTASITRVAKTLEERVAEVERLLLEFRSEVTEQNRAMRSHIQEVKTELSTAIASNQAALNGLSDRVVEASVGGFKGQIFGTFLAIYGASTSVFA